MTSVNTNNKSKRDNKPTKHIHPYLSGVWTLVVGSLFAIAFVFALMAHNTKSNFLNITRYKFSKTTDVLTLGEKLLDFSAYSSVLIFAVAFLMLFCCAKKLPLVCSTVLLTATLLSVGGMALFFTLNTYSIIELFNTLSNAKDSIGSEMKSYYTNLLCTLISLELILPVLAGTMTRFTTAIKTSLTTDKIDKGGAMPFAITNLIFALWHVISYFLISKLTEEYFDRSNTVSTGYLLSELAIIITAVVFSIYTFGYYRICRKNSTTPKEI